jgi:formylglycine-generating enzyme required for sulfatase activity
VPGGSFYRSYDGVTNLPPYNVYTSNAYPATVSDFRLDRFEATVGRFRTFVATFSRDMIPSGAGKNPNDPSDPGWDTAWNASLPFDEVGLRQEVAICGQFQTWTDNPGGDENKPITCTTWYVAFAFCVWDGGRLPTEAEWNYAAAGGSEQRRYPWVGNSLDATYANYGRLTFNNVGSESGKGDGKWGQADLAGNVAEWVLDWYVSPYPQIPCVNCSNKTVDMMRAIRGGSILSDAPSQLSSSRGSLMPVGPNAVSGVRCARSP